MAEDTQFGRRLLFDFFIHEAENIHNRVDWFLIFHGILFEAFMATHYWVHRLTLGVLGCLVSYVWFVAGIRQLWNLRELVSSVKSKVIMGDAGAQVFSAIYAARKNQPGWMSWASATPAFSMWLPMAVFIAWLAVTATYGECGIRLWPLIVTGVAITLLTLLWLLIPGPNAPAEPMPTQPSD